MTNLKTKNNTKITNWNWESFRSPAANNFPLVIPEKVSYAVSFPKQDSLNGFRSVSERYGTSSVLLLNNVKKTWDTLFSNLKTYKIILARNADKLFMVFSDPYNDDDILLLSNDGGKNWQVAFYKESFCIKDGFGKVQAFQTRAAAFHGDSLYVKGIRAFSYYPYGKSITGTFLLHVGLDTNSSRYSIIADEAQNEIDYLIDSIRIKFKSDHVTTTRSYNAKNYPNRSTTYLKNGEFGQGRYYSSDVVLKLKNGKFEFNGKNWVMQPISDNAGNYNSTGTYSFNDSTITFFEDAEFGSDTVNWSQVSFVPRGTYYWWFTKNQIILFKWDDALYRRFDFFFMIMEEDK